MKVVNCSTVSALAPQFAIVIYGSGTHRYGRQGAADNVYATVHEISCRGGKKRLKAGTPINRTALTRTLQRLSSRDALQIVPPDVLAIGTDYVAWWLPPARRAIWFGEGTTLRGRHGIVVQPGVIFVAIRNDIYVVAVKGNERPDASTPVYMAPYFNVWSQGRVCKGNVPFPSHPSIDVIAQYTSAFFDSYSTTPNVQRGLVRFRGGPTTLWGDLLDGKHDAFPETALVPLKNNLKGYLQTVIEEQYARD